MSKNNTILPLIPLRELVALPAAIIPILVGREKSINALKSAREEYNGLVFLSMQTNQLTESPTNNEISQVGVIARIERSAEQNNGSFRVVIHGLERGKILE
ncbi:MAG: LON peptidase substrate-binding domain-containing protein, partial [Candidatus Aminicenantes bacterium]|nr:LON peptidase substrate-binding domain-containing protein [Candidatus Aminicenantes bacterium]